MPQGANSLELQELACIADAVRKEMTLTIRDWSWKDWPQRFAEGLLAHGVTVSEHETKALHAGLRGRSGGVVEGRVGGGGCSIPFGDER